MSVLDGLDVFVAICEAGSIAGAGRELGVPRATLSRQLSRLEEELGVRLLHRSTRRLVRTAAGEELFVRARRVVDEAVAAREAVRLQDDVPRGVVHVSIPPDLAPDVGQVFLDFLDRFPQVRLELDATPQHVDLVAAGIDVALRGGQVADPSLIARSLVRTQVRAFASERYLEARGVPGSPEDLVDHDCILGFAQGRTPRTSWPLLAGGEVPVEGRLVVNSLSMQLHAAVAGHGIALLPGLGLDAERRGLRSVLTDTIGIDSRVSLVYPERGLMLPRVRAFIDFVAEEIPRRIHHGGFAGAAPSA